MKYISRIYTMSGCQYFVQISVEVARLCAVCQQNYIKQTYGRCKPPSTLLQLKGYYFVLFSPPPDKATPHHQICYRSVADRTRSVCEYVCMYVYSCDRTKKSTISFLSPFNLIVRRCRMLFGKRMYVMLSVSDAQLGRKTKGTTCFFLQGIYSQRVMYPSVHTDIRTYFISNIRELL